MTTRRRREVESMITDLGLVIGGIRTNGTSHWRVDVLTPDRKHQRPFTFSCSGFDGPRRYEEVSMLKRWRRSVAPELEVAESAGTLRPAVKTTLAQKLEEMGIPLHREEPTPTVHIKPKAKKMQQETLPAIEAPAPEKARRERMTFTQVMEFGLWMNPARLTDSGAHTVPDFQRYASAQLGFPVSRKAVTQWLNDKGVQMPSAPPKVRSKGDRHQLNEDIATLALALSDLLAKAGLEELCAQATAIAERRTGN